MKKLMFILMMLVIATSTYSDSLSEWWEGLTRDERIDVLQTYWDLINGTIEIDEIEYEAHLEGDTLVLIPIYPEGQTYYILTLGGVIFELELPDLRYKGFVEKKSFIETNALPFTIGLVAGLIIGIAISN